MIQRGDIRWFRFSSPDKRRPVVVLGRPDILPSLSQVPVIPPRFPETRWGEVRTALLDILGL
jgi:hypothetical protein